jgi:hypothetical protein
VKDIGFASLSLTEIPMTCLWLYELGKSMNLEFATASFHNSYYFHKDDNFITNKDEVMPIFRTYPPLAQRTPSQKRVRALFNLGLIGYINASAACCLAKPGA